jgi:transcriptional regulator with XRE-family HTH domain
MARRKRPEMALEPTYFREWRKHRDLTLAQVAESIEIDSTAISRLERGASPYDQFHLQQLSALYRCTIPELLYVDPRRPRPVDELVKKAARLNDADDIKAATVMIEALIARQ